MNIPPEDNPSTSGGGGSGGDDENTSPRPKRKSGLSKSYKSPSNPKVYLTKPTPPAGDLINNLSTSTSGASANQNSFNESTSDSFPSHLAAMKEEERKRTTRVRIEVPTGLTPPSSDSQSVVSYETRQTQQQILHLSFPKKIVAGSGHILNDLCASLWFSYLLLYLQKVVGFSSDYAAGLMLLGQIVDAISTPLVGYEADRPNNCFLCRKNYGRCKSWHLIGIVLVMFSFPFVFTTCIGCSSSDDWAKLIYYAPFIAIFQIGWASTQISHLALIPKMTPDELVRTEILAIRYGFTIASNVTVFLMTWFVLGFSEDCTIDEGDASSFRDIALAAVGIGSFFSVLFHFYVKEQSDDKVKKAVTQLKSQGALTDGQLSGEYGNSPSSSSRSNVVRRKGRKNIRSRSRSRTPDDLLEKATNESDGESGTALLLSDSDNDEECIINVDKRQAKESQNISESQRNEECNDDLVVEFKQESRGLSTRNLNLGKENMTLKDWLSLPQFYMVAVMYMSTRLSVNVTQVYMPLYLQYSLRLPCGTVATIPLTMYLSGFVCALFIKALNKYWGRQLSYIFGASLCLIGSSCILFLDWTPGGFLAEKGIYGVAAVLGGGASAILITSLSITADLIGNNVENGAFVYGAMSFSDKLSCGLVIMLINGLVPCQKTSDDCKNSFEMVPFYSKVLGYACGGCAIVGVLAVIAMTYRIHLQNQRQARQTNQLH